MVLKVRLDMQFSSSFHLDLAFSAESGQTTVLLGESGAGKSTVLRLLAGLQDPQDGLIELDGTTYFDSARKWSLRPQERPFGYVFQDYILFPHLSVYENVAFGLRAQGLSRRIFGPRVEEALAQVGMSDYMQRMPAQLSGGQQQRVAIARALVLQPALLLLDEPLAALDVQTRREVRQELRKILRTTGITTLLVTHNYIEALLLGQEILVLDHGRIIQQGTRLELLQRPRSTYIAELVGVNFFQGRIIAWENQFICTVQLDRDGQSRGIVQATMEESTDGAGLPEIGQEASIVVDPRSITLHREKPEGSARNSFYGEIVQILQHTTYNRGQSGEIRVSLLLENASIPLIAEITAASAERMDLREGNHIYASFKAMEAHAYL